MIKEEVRPTARGPPPFSTGGPGLGLNSRPDSRAGPGPRFSAVGFSGPGPAHGQDYAQRLGELGATCLAPFKTLVFFSSVDS